MGGNDPRGNAGGELGLWWVRSAASLCLQLQGWWGMQGGGNCTGTGAWAASCWEWDVGRQP